MDPARGIVPMAAASRTTVWGPALSPPPELVAGWKMDRIPSVSPELDMFRMSPAVKEPAAPLPVEPPDDGLPLESAPPRPPRGIYFTIGVGRSAVAVAGQDGKACKGHGGPHEQGEESS